MTRTATQKRQYFRQQLESTRAIVAPGVYDGYGARLVQQGGFEAVYMTGNGISASLLGRPDVGLVDLTMISDHARRVARCVEIPLICDADTGYGNVVNVARTVAEFEAAGVAAIHIEDQISPKRCAQMAGARNVLDFDESVSKIAAAVAAKSDPSFVIIARTDSAEALGLQEAIRRAQAFRDAGADAVFLEIKANPEILAQIRQVKDQVGASVVVNMDTGGQLRAMHADSLKAAGIDIAIYPALARGVFGHAMTEALTHLRGQGSIVGYVDHMFTSAQYNDALGLKEIEAWESRFSIESQSSRKS